MGLKEIIEAKFEAKFLFDRMREAWRELVSPADRDGLEQPPAVPVSTILGFVDVSVACTTSTNDERVKEIAGALADSTLVRVTKDDFQSVALQRREWINDDEDPIKRTVFAKPVHVESSEEQIAAFFSKYGEVEAVQLRTFVDAAMGTKRRPSALITFKTVGDAAKCVAMKPSYGQLQSDLANLFVPKLTVMLQEAYEEQQADEVEREYAHNQKQQLVHAQRSAPAAGAQSASGNAGGHFAEVKKFLTPGRTCVIHNVPAEAAWDSIKSRLGGLAVDLPELKGKITMVKIVDGAIPGAPSASRTAFVVTKTPRAANDLALAYNRAQEATFMEKIRAVAPSLVVATAEEDKYAIRNFSEWSKRKVEHRIDANQRRRGEN